jgi:hypothetical protein
VEGFEQGIAIGNSVHVRIIRSEVKRGRLQRASLAVNSLDTKVRNRLEA